jgi:hypothetical protein
VFPELADRENKKDYMEAVTFSFYFPGESYFQREKAGLANFCSPSPAMAHPEDVTPEESGG